MLGAEIEEGRGRGQGKGPLPHKVKGFVHLNPCPGLRRRCLAREPSGSLFRRVEHGADQIVPAQQVDRALDRAIRQTASAFLRSLIAVVPHKIYTVLTDNGVLFCDLPKNRTGPTAMWRTHRSDMVCELRAERHLAQADRKRCSRTLIELQHLPVV